MCLDCDRAAKGTLRRLVKNSVRRGFADGVESGLWRISMYAGRSTPLSNIIFEELTGIGLCHSTVNGPHPSLGPEAGTITMKYRTPYQWGMDMQAWSLSSKSGVPEPTEPLDVLSGTAGDQDGMRSPRLVPVAE
jgi:hypothetical protein